MTTEEKARELYERAKSEGTPLKLFDDNTLYFDCSKKQMSYELCFLINLQTVDVKQELVRIIEFERKSMILANNGTYGVYGKS